MCVKKEDLLFAESKFFDEKEESSYSFGMKVSKMKDQGQRISIGWVQYKNENFFKNLINWTGEELTFNSNQDTVQEIHHVILLYPFLGTLKVFQNQKSFSRK